VLEIRTAPSDLLKSYSYASPLITKEDGEEKKQKVHAHK
jgi:hypothetical protein